MPTVYDDIMDPSMMEVLRKRYNLDSPATGVLSNVVRDAVTFPQRFYQTIAQNPVGLGLSRSDYTDIPGDEPANPAIGMATDVAMNMAGGFIPATEKGAAGVFGGRLAATADKAALAQAESMAAKGATRQQIWDETGWFQGADGKWRFEIPDDALAVTEGWGRGLAGPITHPDLARAYPDRQPAANISMAGPTSRGVYYDNTRGMDIQASSSESARSIAAHELQHWIQQRENLAKGTNPDYMTELAVQALDKMGVPANAPQRVYDRAREAAFEAYMRHAGEVEARNVQRRLGMSPETRRQTPPFLTEDRPLIDQIVTGLR